MKTRLILDFNYQIFDETVHIYITYKEPVKFHFNADPVIVTETVEHLVPTIEFTQPINWGTVEEYILNHLPYYTEFIPGEV